MFLGVFSLRIIIPFKILPLQSRVKTNKGQHCFGNSMVTGYGSEKKDHIEIEKVHFKYFLVRISYWIVC
jgi:hypothetical protein